MAELGTPIEITRFVNPHLFWFINLDDVSKRSELEEKLAGISNFCSVKNLRIGQYVLIYIDKWIRAIARDLKPEGVIYWLIDYGILLECSNTAFSVPEEFTRVEPIAKQAALKDVVCIKQIFRPLDIQVELVTHFSVGSIKCFKDHLQNATAISFSCVEQQQNIYVGELYLKNSNHIWYNVAQILASQDIVAFNEQFFNTAFIENTKAETAFMQSSTANARDLQNLLDHLEQYPQSGRGRGVALPQTTSKLHFPGTTKEDNASETASSEATSNLHASGTSNERIFDNSELMKDLPAVDSKCSAMPKSNEHKSAVRRLSELKKSSANVNQSTDLDRSANSENQLNLSSTSERSDGSSKGAIKKILALKPSRKSAETSECSFSTAKSCLSKSEESVESTEKKSKKSVYKRLQELKAEQPRGGEQTFSETSNDSISQSEEIDFFESTSLSGKSQQSSFFDSDRRKCHYGQGVCDCSNCYSWRSTQLYYSNEQGFVDNDKKKLSTKPIERPPLLLKTSEEKIPANFMKSYTTIVKSKTDVEIACIPKILVHGRSFPQPVPSIASVPFHRDIHAHMRKYEKIFDIQSYVWPSLMRSMNVCMVTPANRGKTVAYMPAVLSYLLEKDNRYVNLPKQSSGPIVIILCSSIQIAEEVEAVASDMLRYIRKRPVCTLAVPPIDNIFYDQFKACCDLLVTTPPTLMSLLNSKVIDINRLCHLVIENCDKILDTYFENLNIILNVIQAMLARRVCNNPVQLITTAECWTPALESFMKQIESVPVVYIGSFLEAALYGRAQLQLSFVASKQKVKSLIDILDQSWKTKRSVVLFNEDSEIDEVKEHLLVHGIQTLCIYNYTSKTDVMEMQTRWSFDTSEGKQYMVMLCTDQVFADTLNITKACVLVHYSLPNRWNKFITRFGCLIESYQSPLTENKATVTVQCEVHIFVDEDCNEQFSRLLELLVRMGVTLSDKYCDFYKKLTNKREQENIQSEVVLCPKLMLFGECPAHVRDPGMLSRQEATRSFISRSCCNRHMLAESLDKPNELPNSGTINYKILRVKNVNCITVKILEWIDAEGKKHTMENFDDIDVKLKEALDEHKISVGNVIVNNSYVYLTEVHETCSRCVVLKVTKTENITKRASMALVRFLDTGIEWNVATVDLYEMPIEFKLIPSQSVDLYIANMIPPHLDDSWSKYCVNRVVKLLRNENYESDGVYGISRIYLRLGDVFWVDNVLVKENLTMSNLALTRLNLRKALLDANLTTYSENQLKKLYHLCEEGGFTLPDYKMAQVENHVIVPSVQQATPQWAHLDPDDDCISVYLVQVDTPDIFYVRLQKFDNLFMSLQKEIQKAITEPNYKSEFDVKINKFYLAKDPGGDEFCRAQVKCIDDDNVTCYYVDYGDFSIVKKSELKFLPDYLITKLPFQAIECRLYGLSPVLDKWQDQAITIMENYIFEPGTDFFRTLYCNICTTETAINTEGKKYSVILVDYFRKQVIFVNQQLIYHGEAVSLEGETLVLNFITFPENKEELLDEEHDEVLQENGDQIQESQEENLSDDDEPIFDFCIMKPEAFISEVTAVNIPPRRAIASRPDPELPPMVALPTPDYSTPKVVWYQTYTHIKLNIELIGVEDFNLRVIRQKFLSFKTFCNDKRYQLDLQLFDKVVERVETANRGLQLQLTIEKCVPCSWPRLLNSTKSMKYIKYDYSKCEIDDDDENKRILDFGSDFQDDLSDGNPFDYESGCDEEDVSDVESLS